MKISKTLIAAALVGAAVAAQAGVDAAQAKEVATKSACLSCHAVDKKLVGPAFKDVAAKYKGMDVAKLAASIKAGGAGKWGPIPMPAQAALKDEDAQLLAGWILDGAPAK